MTSSCRTEFPGGPVCALHQTSAPSDVGGGVCGGEVIHAKSNHLLVGWRRVWEMAGEDLAAGFSEILRQECIEDRVNAGVSIGQAVGHDTEG